MIVAGVMSGTSADGINVAVVDIDGRGFNTRFRLLAHEEFRFAAAVRRKILSVMNATSASVAELSQLNFRLGELYAAAIASAAANLQVRPGKNLRRLARARSRVDLVGCHGQTIYHQGEPSTFLGARVASTWQTGEAAVIAARVGCPVVSDFRTADMAAGGKGAPLVPFLDYLLYRDRRAGRIVQNIGGIANLTAIPPNATSDQVVAFDTGPGNMVMDQLMERLYGRRFDKDGRIAASGRVIRATFDWASRHPFFRRRPPRTAGREEFGREFVDKFLKRCGRAPKPDIVATATWLTATSIANAVHRYALPVVKPRSGAVDFILSGGGARNRTLVQEIDRLLAPAGVRVKTTDEFGLPSEAKEAVAFAVLAYQTWHREPSNVPSATGAKRPAILGKISYP